MLRKASLFVILIVLAAVIAMAQQQGAAKPPAKAPAKAPAAKADPKVERGRYLVSIMGCMDCHTPMKMGPRGPEPDMTRMLSGHPQNLQMPPAPKLGNSPWVWIAAGTNTAFAGPWGVSYAFNLTSDKTTGIGLWREEQFVQAIKTGKHMGSARPIMPPMPWPAYRNATTDDLKAVFAYLNTVPAIKNQVPDAIIAPPPPPPAPKPAK
jgi:hypothetical protein